MSELRLGRSATACVVVALALVIVAARFAIVAGYANSIPWLEEWDVLIHSLARQFADGTLTLGDLFEPNNEHTIFFTRLVFAASLALNHGQYDNVPVAVFDTLLAAAVWCLPAWLLLRRAPAGMSAFAALFVIVGALPLGYVNTLHGFQSQFYFLLLGVLSSLWLAADTDEFRPGRFALFVLGATVATISMGSGFLGVATASGVLALRRWHEPERVRLRALVPMIAVGIASVAIGAWLLLRAKAHMPTDLPQLDLHDEPIWIVRLLSCAAWPYAKSAIVGLLVSLPFCAFAWRMLRRGSAESTDWFVFGLGTWLVGQIVAMAVYRHITADILPNRYVDMLVFWPLANLYSLLRLIAHSPLSQRLRAPWVTAAAALAFAIAIGVRAPGEFDALKLRSGYLASTARRVADYVGGDTGAFEAPGFPQAPHWSIPRLKSYLDDPLVRDALPPNLRAPLLLQADAAAADAAFVPGGVAPGVADSRWPGYGSYASSGERGTGVFRSQPMRSAWPYLVVGVAGDLPGAGLALSLGDKRIRPDAASPMAWQSVAKRTPKGDFRIQAEDASTTGWFAFTAPREAGRLSAIAIDATAYARAHAPRLTIMVGIAVVLLLVGAFRYRRSPAD